jgi:cytidyltransferase-like protein
MKIGIFSGFFDPPHAGHRWIVQEASLIFEEVHVVLGPNPTKTETFSEQERLEMLEDIMPKNCGIKILKLPEQDKTVADYGNRIYKETRGNLYYGLDTRYLSVTFIRGLRDEEDFNYEDNILQCMKKKSGLPHVYLIPPYDLRFSSTNVRNRCTNGNWQEVERMTNEKVALKLYNKYTGNNWLVTEPKVASIFETGTAGFGPIGGFPSDDCGSLQQMASGCDDDSQYWHANAPEYQPNQDIDAAREHHNRLVEAGIIKYPFAITREQVEATLDPFPYKVCASDTYHLMEIPVDKVGVLGNRFVPQSRSFSPIIVDDNQLPAWFDSYGPIIVIEGKHRLLDARQRGEKTIMAWVGSCVIDNFTNEEI